MLSSRNPKADRRVLTLLLGVLGLIVLCLDFHMPENATTEVPEVTFKDTKTQSHRDAEWQRRKEEREQRYLHLKDSFAMLKLQRQQAAFLRQQAYQHRKDSFAALKEQRIAAREEREAKHQHYLDSLKRTRPEKLSDGEFIYLNQADTTLLKRVPGIGSALAFAIVSYRQRLRGFHQVQQLLEIKGITENSLPYFRVQGFTPSLYINKESVNAMRQHPYLSFYQARAIDEYRKKYGPIHSLRQLSLLKEFCEDDFTRLEPYVVY